MIGRADIEGSNSAVAVSACAPQASYPYGNFLNTTALTKSTCNGSLKHAFTLNNPKEKDKNQTSFYHCMQREISVPTELAIIQQR